MINFQNFETIQILSAHIYDVSFSTECLACLHLRNLTLSQDDVYKKLQSQSLELTEDKTQFGKIVSNRCTAIDLVLKQDSKEVNLRFRFNSASLEYSYTEDEIKMKFSALKQFRGIAYKKDGDISMSNTDVKNFIKKNEQKILELLNANHKDFLASDFLVCMLAERAALYAPKIFVEQFLQFDNAENLNYLKLHKQIFIEEMNLKTSAKFFLNFNAK